MLGGNVKEKEVKKVQRGEIWFVNVPKIDKEKTCVQQGCRPAFVISCKENNDNSTTVNVIYLSSKIKSLSQQTHVIIGSESGLRKTSIVLCEQFGTLDLDDLQFKIGECPEHKIKEVELAFGLQTETKLPFDIEKVNELVFYINEYNYRYERYEDELFGRTLENYKKQLIDYCNEYCRDYRTFLKELSFLVKDNNTNMKYA